MTVPLETKFKAEVISVLKDIDGLYYFVKEAKALRGLPDIVGCYRGVFFGWELKRSASEANKKTGRIVLQRYILTLIQNAGGIGEIVHPDNLEDSLKQLRLAAPTLH